MPFFLTLHYTHDVLCVHNIKKKKKLRENIICVYRNVSDLNWCVHCDGVCSL